MGGTRVPGAMPKRRSHGGRRGIGKRFLSTGGLVGAEVWGGGRAQTKKYIIQGMSSNVYTNGIVRR